MPYCNDSETLNWLFHVYSDFAFVYTIRQNWPLTWALQHVHHLQQLLGTTSSP